jgi:hypothetical protein
MGDSGFRGPFGSPGPHGSSGQRGFPGVRGKKGDFGDAGMTGQRGIKGDIGDSGMPGTSGRDVFKNTEFSLTINYFSMFEKITKRVFEA